MSSANRIGGLGQTCECLVENIEKSTRKRGFDYCVAGGSERQKKKKPPGAEKHIRKGKFLFSLGKEGYKNWEEGGRKRGRDGLHRQGVKIVSQASQTRDALWVQVSSAKSVGRKGRGSQRLKEISKENCLK